MKNAKSFVPYTIASEKRGWILAPTADRWTDVRHWDASLKIALLYWKT